MTTSLLTTKLYIPTARPGLVSRPRLIKQLNEGLHRKLTLISAPAGFGKTTMISEWIHQKYEKGGEHPSSRTLHPSRVAWLSLDEGDNDHVRFLAYIIAALNQIEGIKVTIGEGSLSMLQSPQPPPTEDALTSLINEIAAVSERIVLVLDDYHLIEAQSAHDALTFLLENQPPQMHLVIATREDPHLPLARLRAKDQLTELRATDLRFTSSEAVEFLNQVMGLNLSVEGITALESRTEGWIAGLQLAAISLQGSEDTTDLIKSFTGSHHFILDYLIEEVLEQQSVNIQAFLLQTSILDRYTGSLCDSLTGQDKGQQTLEYLERANLFIVPLDKERRWYRYHHLFSDLLRQRLRQTQPDLIQTLHHRASEWYERNGFVDEAIEHALRTDDLERAADLIEVHADTVWGRGEHIKLCHWLDGLPAGLVFSKPQLSIFHAWSLFANGQQDAAERCLQAAEQALDPNIDRAAETSLAYQDQLPGPDKIILRGRIATIRAFLASFQGDVLGINKYSLQALEYLPEQDLAWRSAAAVALGDSYSFSGDMAAAFRFRLEALEASNKAGNIYMIMIANLKLAVTLRQQGKLQKVIEICQKQMYIAHESGIPQTVVAGWVLAIWGEVLAEQNDLDGAIDKAEKGAELTERGKDVAMLGWSCLCLIRVLFTRGNMAGAEEIIQKMENVVRDHHVPPWITNLLAAWKGRIWLAQGKLEDVSQWVGERGLDVNEEPTLQHEVEYIVLARILIAQGQLDEATRLLQRLLEAAETGGRTSRVIEILMLQTLALQAGGDTDRAMTPLEQALTLAEPGGFIRIFIDEGPLMAHVLYEALTRGIKPDYARRLLAAFPTEELEKTDSLKTGFPDSELVEPLSEREIEVLQLIAEGLTNPEIAARLYLSLNTIKVHTRNIYAKLGSHNRTQAVARAKALGILPSN